MELNMKFLEYTLALAPLWIYFALLAITSYIIIQKKYFKFDHEQLLRQNPFWIAILVPFFSFLYFGLLAWVGHSPQFDSKGMGNFLEISKLPLLILSLTLPLGALTANIHRTFQTKKQIDLSESKNLSDMYYAHNKSYVENFAKINANREIRNSSNQLLNDFVKDVNNLSVFIGRPHNLYEKLYPNSSAELGPQYKPSDKSLLVIHRLIEKVLDSFSSLDAETLTQKITDGVTKKDKEFAKIRSDMLSLCRYIGLDEYIMYYRFFDIEHENKKVQLQVAIARLFIFCHKLYIVVSEVLNIVGVTKNTHPELINKCKKMRTCASDSYTLLKNSKQV